jgi:hypothetical protein
MSGRLVNVKVAGSYLGVTDRCVRRYACDGIISKYYVLGSTKLYLVSLDELDSVGEKIAKRILAQHEKAKSYGKKRYTEHGMNIFKKSS